MSSLSNTVDRKFIDSITLEKDEWEIETDTGYQPITHIHKTIEYQEWILTLIDGKELVCADTHIVFRDDGTEVFVQDLLAGDIILTADGPLEVASVNKTNLSSNMYDLTVDSEDHRFYTNDILSHNTTTAVALILHYVLFNEFKSVALLANKGDTSQEIMSRIQLAYEALPKWIQQGIINWNKRSFELENGSKVFAASTSSSSIRGKSCITGDTRVCIKYRESIENLSLEILSEIDCSNFKILSQNSIFEKFKTVNFMGNKPTYILKTTEGTVESTIDHRFLTANLEWIELKDISEGFKLHGGDVISVLPTFLNKPVFDVIDVENTNSFKVGNLISHNCNLIYIDEAAYVDNWDEFFKSTYPTISSGNTTKLLLTSTPNGLNHFWKLHKGAIDKTNGYEHVEVMWNDVPGRDEAWRQETLQALDNDVEKFAQEYCIEYQGSSGTLISGEHLKRLSPSIPILQENGIKQYIRPEDGHVYVLVADVSQGKGLDYSAFQIIDITKMPYKQVCIFRDNYVSPGDYASIIFRMGQLYNKASILVEVNDVGSQVADSLYLDFGCEELLFTENAGSRGKKIAGGFSGRKVDRGIRTSKTVKSVGCSIMKLLIEQQQLILIDYDTINELSRFSKKGSSYEAEPGSHDDTVMPLVLFAWLSSQAFFKDLTDINTLAKLRDKTEAQIEEYLLPFGFIDDGSGDKNSSGVEVVDWGVF